MARRRNAFLRRALRTRPDDVPQAGIESYESDRITLPEQQQGNRRDQPFGVGQLGEPGGIAGPLHGLAGVQHHDGARVRFLFRLLDDRRSARGNPRSRRRSSPGLRAPRTRPETCAAIGATGDKAVHDPGPPVRGDRGGGTAKSGDRHEQLWT
jgi:hypothetical protein